MRDILHLLHKKEDFNGSRTYPASINTTEGCQSQAILALTALRSASGVGNSPEASVMILHSLAVLRLVTKKLGVMLPVDEKGNENVVLTNRPSREDMKDLVVDTYEVLVSGNVGNSADLRGFLDVRIAAIEAVKLNTY